MQGFLQIRPATIKDFGLLGELERRAAKRFLGVPEATGMSPEQLEETLSDLNGWDPNCFDVQFQSLF